MNELPQRLRSLLRPELAALSAYHVPDARGLIKLDAMENPYSWPEDMIAEWLSELRNAAINRYPDPSAPGLTEALRQTAEVPHGVGLLLGNGSDELIQIILMALSGRDAVVMAPEPTFVMYRQLAVVMGLRFVGVSLKREDFALDMPAMRAAIREHSPSVIFLAYPNNPTGNLFDATDIREIVSLSDGLVVVDEAYLPFAGATFLNEVPCYANLLVMRTLSKMGLAGLRLGYLAGSEAWIREFDKLRLPYNINILTQISAEFALGRAEVFDAQVREIIEQREFLYDALQRLAGIRVYPSRANFILFELLRGQPEHIFRGLRDRGILVKSFHVSAHPLSACLRVTVGKPEENQMFLRALSEVLAECR
jgi:histidinol-phosphate aminotransferase